TDDAHAHVVRDQFLQVGCNKASQQTEYEIYFIFRPRPVLRREAEDGEVRNTVADAQFDHAPQRVDALDMAFGAWLAAGLGPTPMAVHDDPDVSRNPWLQPRAGLTDDGRLARHLWPSRARAGAYPRPA